MSKVTYSSQLPDDDAFYALFETTGWNAKYMATPDELVQAIENSWYSLSAYAEDRLVGFGRVLCDGTMHALILDLIVDPDYQRRGIGSEILSQLTARCKEADIRDIQLFSAHGKAPFYERHGFRPRSASSPGMELVDANRDVPGSS